MSIIKKYRMGVLGLGEGRSIISAALNSEHWELVNVCDLNEALCKERMEEFGLSKYTLDYNDLLKDESIEVIAIYTPDQLHGRHIRQALEAGKHVICTKPLLPSLQEAKEMLECRRKYSGVVFVGQSTRYFEPMLHQREDFEKGLNGEVVSVEAHYITDARWFLERDWSHQQGFSWMHNFMIHAVDLVRWYMPDIVEVYGCGVTSQNSKDKGLLCNDTMKFLLKDAHGKFSVVGGSYATPTLKKEYEPSIACTIRGTKGITRGEYLKLQYNTHFDKQGHVNNNYDDKHDYYFRFDGESHHAGEYQNYIEYFAKALDKGLTPKPDMEEAIVTLAVMEAMRKSIETGLPVRLEDVLIENGLSELLP